MRAIILGGDGFCGWPTALHFASNGAEVLVVDSLVRRKIAEDLSAVSLTPIATIEKRIKASRKIGNISYVDCDIAKQPDRLKSILENFKSDTIVHFAEQRSAPYSMLSDVERRYTVDNNVTGTNNLFSSLVVLNQRPHVVHLGTMGVYGYNDDLGQIPEGYLDVTIQETDKDVSILYPPNPGSIYHMTKCLDHTIMQFYAKNWGFPITDLHQGIVWGTDTELTATNINLINRFDYDGEYGTVLNRMITQSQIGHPLTVYGTGGQSRAFIHISDTTQCIWLAAKNLPNTTGPIRVFNQVAEVHNVLGIAQLIHKKTGAEITYLDNPRKELAENTLKVSNAGLKSLGFKPIILEESLLSEIGRTVDRFQNRINADAITSKARW